MMSLYLYDVLLDIGLYLTLECVHKGSVEYFFMIGARDIRQQNRLVCVVKCEYMVYIRNHPLWISILMDNISLEELVATIAAQLKSK